MLFTVQNSYQLVPRCLVDEKFQLCIISSTDAVAFSNAHFGAGIGTIHLHVVGCTGGETNLTDCRDDHSSFYCLQGHSEDAGVRCQGLKDGYTRVLPSLFCRSNIMEGNFVDPIM